MAPWVFAAPAIAFALLPNVTGATRATNGIALTSAITALTALAGVVIQPMARRLEARLTSGRAAATGLLVCAAGIALGAVTAQSGQMWLLVPCAITLGCAYGLCLVPGLIEVQRLADHGSAAGLTAAYYVLTYLGFSVPYLLALAHGLASYPLLLAITALIAFATAALVARRSSPRSLHPPASVRSQPADG
jgi:hypothetical protein